MNQCKPDIVVAIDAGHGGSDLGACYEEFPTEAAHNLRIAERLNQALLVYTPDVSPVMVRKNLWETISRPQRAMIADMANADLAISLHVDTHENNKINGCKMFYVPGDKKGFACAMAAHMAMPAIMKRDRWQDALFPVVPDDWTKRAYSVLRHHVRRTAILVELGLMTNAGDREAMLDPLIQSLQVGALRQAVLGFQYETRR